MTCHSIYHAAEAYRKELDAPARLTPKCHPRSHLDVYVDSKKKVITVSCAKCDRTIDTIKIRI